MHLFGAELKHALWNRRFAFVILLGLLVLSYSAYKSLEGYLFLKPGPDITPQGVALLQEANIERYKAWFYGMDYYGFLSPLLATLAYAGSYRSDVQTGFVKFVLQRTKRLRYIWTKVWVAMIVGALSTGLPLLLFSALLRLSLKGRVTNPMPMAPSGPFSELYHSIPDLYIGFTIGMLFIFGAVYGAFGLAFSAIFSNRLLAIIAPLIFLFAGTILCDSFGLYRLEPAVANSFYQLPFAHLTDILAHDAVILLGSLFVFLIVARRELYTL